MFAQRAEQPDRLLAVQVKAEQGGGFFLARDLAEARGAGSEEWFVLVSLRGAEDRPSFFVLPRAHVSAAVGTALECFGGRYHQLGAGNFVDYHEAWEQLDAPAAEAAWRLPRWHWDYRDSWEGKDRVRMPVDPPPSAPSV